MKISRVQLTVIAVVIIVVAAIAAFNLGGAAQARAWGIVIAAIGSFFIIWGGWDIGTVEHAGPEKLGYIGLIVGSIMMLSGLYTALTGELSPGMSIPDWLNWKLR